MANLSMDKYVLLQFKSSLREQQRELQQAIDRVEKELRDTADPTADNIDASSRNASRESLAAQVTQNRRKLKTIQVALERIQNGEFGTCAVCGGAIGLKRLQAIPSAIRCLACQERQEQGGLRLGLYPSAAPDADFIESSGA